MILKVLTGIFGTKSNRDIKKLIPTVEEINTIEEAYKQLTDEQLIAKTAEFKERLKAGETIDDIMKEAFAVVKNACRRLCGKTINVCRHELTWDMIPFDVQILGAIVLHRGNIAEMATGEGKTLVATMPLYLNALSGKNCQLVTVSDYHANRDSEWMGSIYTFLGLTVGCIQNNMSPSERREQYDKDITYGTNSEFGFDYLRDMGMSSSQEQLVQRNHFFVIVDEADSILIDEARTPLIISGPAAVSTHQYDKYKPMVAELFKKQSLLCSRLINEARDTIAKSDSTPEEIESAFIKILQVKLGMPKHRQLMHMLQDGAILKRLEKIEMNVKSDQNRGMLQEVQAELYFAIDEKSHEADLTDKGRNAISPNDPDAFILPDLLTSLHNIDEDPTLENAEKFKLKKAFQEKFSLDSERIHNLSQLIKAYCLFDRDVNYIIQDNKVVIVDEHTGRLMPGRRFNEGLHQALEAKEGVTIERETQTFATITIQNYFRLYEKLAGMTGTAESEATELHQIYKTDVIIVPTNKPCIRKDHNDSIYKTKREKYSAILDEVETRHKKGQPVLLGTVSVDVSEVLSRMLKRKNIPHNVLNAKNHAYEADIVARAGQMGAVTVATNMAGRGTDIRLGPGVAELGGLYVIASERHDSRRIDRQLRGRCSRQGDPGESKFYVSLEDDLMRLFGSDRISSIMSKLGLAEGEELQHPLLNRSIETAQKRIEQQHFSIRKRTLEFDDVMNRQREIIYGFRKDVLFSENPKEILFELVEDEIKKNVDMAASGKTAKDGGFDDALILSWLNNTFPLGFSKKDITDDNDAFLEPKEMYKRLFDRVELSYNAKESAEDSSAIRRLERHIILDAIDRLWQEHLYAMDGLRSGISLRAYAQKDPLVEYKHEAFSLFSLLMADLNQEILTNMFRSATTIQAFEKLFASLPHNFIHKEIEQFEGTATTTTKTVQQGNTASSAPRSSASMMQRRPPTPANPADLFAEHNQQPQQNQAEEKSISYKRETDKVGRNDDCPCGSGKKYKKCCGK
ncbi:MAG TPA: preprotein translocase subunit SecA [Lentisphaeria bacterium]|nr:MAG: preprotein translocase subunit SecA [Lentisphaerae bacterium GWF2_38_69]HBM14747.1 preprotein translocase subunit SecA [Lentisphaeria bacterium]